MHIECGDYLFLRQATGRAFHLKDPISTGIGLGTAGHAMGAAVAADLGEVEASMASIALVVVGGIVAVLVPILYPLLNTF
ncbi:MAG: LrgB family protein [Turicibacter sp.]|nr:LrgB family protein [Turicibacter sp.]